MSYCDGFSIYPDVRIRYPDTSGCSGHTTPGTLQSLVLVLRSVLVSEIVVDRGQVSSNTVPVARQVEVERERGCMLEYPPSLK